MVMEVVTDPDVCAALARRKELYDRNCDWLDEHVAEVYSHRGKFVCIAGQEAFVADCVKEAVNAAKAKYPEDDGRFSLFIPLRKALHVHAHTG